ncbi:MAG TPA: FAD:protein FMN transferase [Candidatus Baltobacterales bacterium]|nr:FAD:protein FMN transferase [Candidatus Baltobacterales bacterium]
MPPSTAVESHHFAALGTNCSLFAAGRSPAELLEAEFSVRRLGARLTRFSAYSELSQLNESAGRWFTIGEELEALLRASLRAFEMSAGLVNIAVLPSMLAIGYTRPLSEGATVAMLEGARPLSPLPDVLSVRRGAAHVAAGSALDLGGIAKGWMADRLCEVLGPNALANLGGDLCAVGAGPDGDGWPVGVAGATLMLRGRGAATSSVRRRRWGEVNHLIDPRTGLPSRTGLAEVSVVAAGGLEAEVVAKTALLVGPELAQAYCAAHALAWWLGPADDD